MLKKTEISTSEARKILPRLIDHVQDPRRYVLLTRHGNSVAALVSIEEMQRIWASWDRDQAEAERTPSLRGLVRGPKSKRFVPPEVAAMEMRDIQLDRKGEREILALGGLKEVEGGELRQTVPAPQPERRGRSWWHRLLPRPRAKG